MKKSRNFRMRQIDNSDSFSRKISACCIELAIAAGAVEQERAMWLEVILLAVRDLNWGGDTQARKFNRLMKLNATQGARLFLDKDSPDFHIVCEFAGLDPEFAHRIITASGVLAQYDEMVRNDRD